MKTLSLSLCVLVLAYSSVVAADSHTRLVPEAKSKVVILCVLPHTGRFVIIDGRPGFWIQGCDGKTNQWNAETALGPQQQNYAVKPYKIIKTLF